MEAEARTTKTSAKSYWCSKPLTKSRDTAQRQGELKSGEGEFTSEGGKMSLLGCTTLDFIRLRNESTLTMISVEISTEII